MTKNERNQIIAERIVAAREAKGVTAKELASKIGVSQSRLSNWENATNSVHADYIYMIASILDVSADYLLGISDARTPELSEITFAANTGISLEDLSEESQNKILDFIKFMRAQEKADEPGQDT